MNQTRSSIDLIDDGWAEIVELGGVQWNLDAHAMRCKQLRGTETLKKKENGEISERHSR